MKVTVSGMVTLVKLVQPLNIRQGKIVTPSGIVTVVKSVQSSNAPLNREEMFDHVLPGFIFAFSSITEDFSSADASGKSSRVIDVVLAAIVTLVKLLQP